MAKTLNDGDLLKYGWKVTLEKLGFFIGLFLLTVLSFVGLFVVSIILGVISSSLLGDSASIIIMLLAYAAMISLSVLVHIGWIRISLAIVDKKKTDLKMLFSGWDAFLRFLGASILYGLIVMVGYMLFVIPGVILSLKYMWMPWLVIDKKMGIMDAMQESDRMTMGLKWDLLGFQILTVVVSYLGMFAFFIGSFVTFPTILLATAKLYRSHAK